MATRIVNGKLREVWVNTIAGGALETFTTGLRTSKLATIFGTLEVTPTAGAPVIAVGLGQTVDGFITVNVQNTAPAGNTASWVLNIERNHSIKQAVAGLSVEPGVIQVMQKQGTGSLLAGELAVLTGANVSKTDDTLVDVVSVTLQAGVTYRVEAQVSFSADAAGGVAVVLVAPGGTGIASIHGEIFASAPAAAVAAVGPAGIGAPNKLTAVGPTAGHAHISGIVVGGGATDVLTLQFAQAANNAVPSIAYVGSFLQVFRQG